MSEPVCSNLVQCPFDLILIKSEVLRKYNILYFHLRDLKEFFKETGLYGELTNSIARYYPDFFKHRYKSIKMSDITYYYVYTYKLSLEESPQPIIWRNPNPITINIDTAVYVLPAQRFPFTRIIDRRHSRFGRKRGFDYLVVWEGQGGTQWIPRRRITGASLLIAKFNRLVDQG
jgi:hypothetical protein